MNTTDQVKSLKYQTIPGPFASGSARPKRKIIDLSYSWTI